MIKVNRGVSLLFTVFDGITTLGILAISLSIMGREEDLPETGYLLPALFFVLAGSRLLLAFINRGGMLITFIRHLFDAAVYLACAVMIILNMGSAKILNIVTTLYTVLLIAGRGVAIYKNARNNKIFMLVMNSILILLIILQRVLLAELAPDAMLLIIVVLSVLHIMVIAFSKINLPVLGRILRKTYAAEILFGMVLLVVAFSMVLPAFEKEISTIPDALWYCFAIITTIGFGDMAAATVVGRIMSIILGLYGIIVVALITSIIVNFYNESKIDEEKAQDAGDEPEKNKAADGS